MPRGALLALAETIDADTILPPDAEPEESPEETTSDQDETTLEEEVEDQADDQPSLTDRLKAFGYTGEIPSEIPEHMVPFLEGVLSTSDTRVRGVQSLSTRAQQTYEQAAASLQAKANAYDAMSQAPEFVDLVKKLRGEPTGQIDLEKLPKDPIERLRVLTKEVLREEFAELREDLGQVKSYLGNQGWEQFKTQNPDAVDFAPQIRHYMETARVDLPEAYRMAKGASFDPEAERKQIRADILAEMKDKQKGKKAASAGVRKSAKSADKVSDIQSIGKEKGRRAALLAALEEAGRKLNID